MSATDDHLADVMCIAAHPDDVELAMGGAVAGMVRQGMRVVVVDLTDGEPTPAGTRETRLREALEAAEQLGVRRVTLALPNRSLFDTPEARRLLAEEIRVARPTALFAPYPVDAHPDHVAAAAIATAARFCAKLTKTDMRGEPHYPPRIFRYFPLHLRVQPKPSFLLDVSPDFDRKMRAVACYASQFVHNPRNAGVPAKVELNARHWGTLLGVTHAEPFHADEELGLNSIAPLLP